MEILVERIVEVESQQCLALHAEGGLVLERDADVGTGVDDALVGNGDRTHGIVDRIVAVLGQRDTAGGDYNRTTGDVGGIEFDDATRTGLVFTGKDELVLVAELLRNDERRVIEFGVDILLGDVIIPELTAQVLTERFGNREDDLTGRGLDGVILDVVKATVDIGLLVGIEAVEVHHLQQGYTVDITCRDVGQLGTCCVTEVLDIEFEVVFLNLIGTKGVDILHGKVPHAVFGRGSGTLQHLDVERLVGRGDVAREFADPIGASLIGVFIGHSEDLVAGESRLEHDVTEA